MPRDLLRFCRCSAFGTGFYVTAAQPQAIGLLCGLHVKSVSVVVRHKFFSTSLSATRPARFTAFALLFFLFGRLLKETDLRFDATCDFNLVEKRVRGDTAIPFDVDKSTPHVIDDTLDGPLSESLVGSDLFRGTTFHAVLV
jgi:hypothetical protein